jgi:outer membrane murein-binding lipoprotein Lpp
MKKTLLVLVFAVILTGIIFTGCKSNKQKIETAQENVDDANEALDEANDAYLKDIEKYRIEAANKIAANEQITIDFNKRIETEKLEAQVEYKLKIAELDKKNTDLKKKMDDYKETGKENWEKFKKEFNKDMEELGKAFKDLTVKNSK